jgi:hypothetical protein
MSYWMAFNWSAVHGCVRVPTAAPDGLYLFRRDGRGFVAPALTDVREHGSQVIVRQRGAHRGHGQIPLLAFHLDRAG